MLESFVSAVICLASSVVLPAQLRGPTFRCQFFSPLFPERGASVFAMGGGTHRCPFSPGHREAWEPEVSLPMASADLEHEGEGGGLPGRSGRRLCLFTKPRSPFPAFPMSGKWKLLIGMVLAHFEHFYCQTLEQIASKKGGI